MSGAREFHACVIEKAEFEANWEEPILLLGNGGFNMSKELELYKIFIDGLVERKDSMTARWVKGDGSPRRRTIRRKTSFSPH